MKSIVFVLSHYNINGGVARVLTTLCNNFDFDKYDITIMPLYKVDKQLVDTLDKRVKVKPCLGFYFRGLDKLVSLLPPVILYKWFVRKKYDIEVAFQCATPTKMVAASTNKKAVRVFWVHTYELYRECFLNSDGVYCVSKHDSEICKRELEERVPVDYCYNLTDDSKIIELSKETADFPETNCLKLVTVGRLSPEKGYMRLVTILKELRDEGYSFRLVIVGDGPERDLMEQSVADNNMQDWIKLVGKHVNPHKFTAKGDVFVCSSFSEGYSTACTEAAILGVPIITTNVPGGEEIIGDAECGIVTGMDDQSLKAAIKKVLDNPKLVAEWKSVMSHTCEKFKLQARKDRAMAIFDKLSALSDKRINLKE